MESPTIRNASDNLHQMPVLPADMRFLTTQFGTFEFEEVICQVYGEKIYTVLSNADTKTDVGTRSASEFDLIHEFWVRPLADGTKDQLIKLKNHDFRAANGQMVLLMFAKGKTNFEKPLLLINLDSKEAVEFNDLSLASKHVQDELVGMAQDSALLLLFIIVLGATGFAWYKTSSMVATLATFVVSFAGVSIIGSKMPFFNSAVANANNRDAVDKKFRTAYESICGKLTESQGLHWAGLSGIYQSARTK